MHLGLGWQGRARPQTKPDFLLGIFSFWKPFRLHLMIFLSFHANTHAFPCSPPPPSHKYSYSLKKKKNNPAVLKAHPEVIQRFYLVCNLVAELCMSEAGCVCHGCVLERLGMLTIFTLKSHIGGNRGQGEMQNQRKNQLFKH